MSKNANKPNVFGAILRFFNPETDKDKENYNFVKLRLVLIECLENLLSTGLFRTIHVLIPVDRGYDNGKSYDWLLNFITRPDKKNMFRRVSIVQELNNPYFTSELLNLGIGYQLQRGINFSLIMSMEYLRYISRPTIVEMTDHLQNGAKAVFLKLPRLGGHPFDNVFSFWSNWGLQQTGCFGSRPGISLNLDNITPYKGGEVFPALMKLISISGDKKCIGLVGSSKKDLYVPIGNPERERLKFDGAKEKVNNLALYNAYSSYDRLMEAVID